MFSFLLYNIVGYLQGDMTEDLIFRDIGCLGGIWHNWASFWPYFLQTFLMFLLLQTRGQKLLLNFWRHDDWSVSLRNAILPVYFPRINFDKPVTDPCELEIIFTTNLIFAYANVYYNWQWVDLLDRKRRKLTISQSKKTQ